MSKCQRCGGPTEPGTDVCVRCHADDEWWEDQYQDTGEPVGEIQE